MSSPSYHTFISYEFESKFDDSSDNNIDILFMNTTEAINALVKADPTRSYCVHVEEWQHFSGTHSIEYVIYATPGINGNDYIRLTSPLGFEKPVADYITALNQSQS